MKYDSSRPNACVPIEQVQARNPRPGVWNFAGFYKKPAEEPTSQADEATMIEERNAAIVAGLQKKDEPPKPEDPILEHISEINMPKKSLDNTHIYDIGETGFETFKYLIPSKPGDVKGKFSTGSGGIDIGKNPLMDPVYPPDTFKDIEISPELLERIKDTYKKLTGDKDKK